MDYMGVLQTAKRSAENGGTDARLFSLSNTPAVCPFHTGNKIADYKVTIFTPAGTLVQVQVKINPLRFFFPVLSLCVIQRRVQPDKGSSLLRFSQVGLWLDVNH